MHGILPYCTIPIKLIGNFLYITPIQGSSRFEDFNQDLKIVTLFSKMVSCILAHESLGLVLDAPINKNTLKVRYISILRKITCQDVLKSHFDDSTI